MEKPSHIYVIGAGLIGLSTADSLVARGIKVTVLDKRGGPGRGASFSNSGMIHPSQARPWLDGDFSEQAQEVLALAERSKRLLCERMEALGLHDAKRQDGCVQLFDSIVMGEVARENYSALGVATEIVTGAPHTFGRYALKFPEDRSGNAFEYCKALERHLQQVGVMFKYAATEDDVFALMMQCDPVVIAAGTGSVSICRNLGIDLPVYPERGFALNFSKPDIELPTLPIMHHASRSAMTVFDDHLRLSGMVAEYEVGALVEVWEEIAPDIIDKLDEPLNMWRENRPMSRLGRPIIGHVKNNVWVNTGHGHMGWTLSAGSGEYMADVLLNSKGDDILNPFVFTS